MDKILVSIIARLPSSITSRFAADKLKHFIMGAAIAVPFALFGFPLLGLLAVAIVGFGKEALDYQRNNALINEGKDPAHGVELADAAATVFGGVVVLLISVVIRAIF